MSKFENKVVWITGESPRNGAAFAESLSAKGAQTAATYAASEEGKT